MIMIAAFGGPTVRLRWLRALRNQRTLNSFLTGSIIDDGVLLANHGAIVTGPNMQRVYGAP